MSRNKDIDQHIDRTVERIRATELPTAEAEDMAGDVWRRLEGRLAAESGATTAEVATIRGCDDYQALIPAFLSGDLAPSRALLFEDHTRHCVPCRKALKAARSGEKVATGAQRGASQGWNVRRFAAAAMIAVAAGATGYFMWASTPAHPYGAIVESAGDGLFRVSTLEPVAVGEQVAVGERLRTAAGETPVLRLPDGTAVEVRERSEFSIDSRRRGTTVRIERGEVIVEAADQGRGKLYVSTDDCLVSVKGTIFGVSSGTKGSRVSVIEGEVRVDYGGQERALFAGDRTTTYAAYGAAPVNFNEELAWSQNIDRYLALLAEVQELRQALERDLPWPGLRYSSRLLDLTPDDVAFYAAFPNLAETLVEANRIVEEQVQASPLLSEWWNSSEGGPQMREVLDRATEIFGEAGSYLGDEVVVAVAAETSEGDNDMGEPVFLAELTDAAGLRAFLEAQMAEHADSMDAADHVAIHEGELPAALPEDGMIIWLGDDTMVAGPDAERVRSTVARVTGGGGGPVEGFKAQVAEAYADGADILVAMDLQKVGPAAEVAAGSESLAEMERTGILDAQHLILQHRRIDGRTHNDAVLAFNGPRRGVAGWLAEPAPMGSLAYISPDAKLAAAAVMTSPAEIFDEMFALAAENCAHAELEEGQECDPAGGLERMQAELGVNLRDDVAAALGGEVAVALDGPVIPEPAWKVIMEVYDPPTLVWALQQMVAYANVKLAEAGQAPIEFVEEPADGRIYYGVDSDDENFRFAFDEGYLIAAPNRALVDRAIRFRQSGYTLESSSRFTGLLPEDGRTNFSALVYQDALSLLEPLAQRIAESELTEEQSAALDALRGETDPILAYAYGEESRIVFAASGIGDLFASGLPGLISMGLIEQSGDAAGDDEAAESIGDTV